MPSSKKQKIYLELAEFLYGLLVIWHSLEFLFQNIGIIKMMMNEIAPVQIFYNLVGIFLVKKHISRFFDRHKITKQIFAFSIAPLWEHLAGRLHREQ